MEFYALLDQVVDLLRSRGRVSYRALKLQFNLQDEAVAALKDELIAAQQLAVDEQGTVLVWTGDTTSVSPPAVAPASAHERAPVAYTPPHLRDKIRSARAALEGERKQVTVLFADLKDSTELIRGLDPEAAQQLLDPALHRMMDAVHRFEGTVNQVLGDGIMALFGAPIAHEDHALRGEVWGQALVYCQQAGEKALARSAYREAIGHLEQALSALPHLPETRNTHEQAIDLRLALRTALAPSADLERILAYLREAETLAEALVDPRRLGQVSRFLSLYFHYRGAHDQAIAAAQRALALATASGEVILHALANQYLGYASQAQGDYRWAIDCYRQTVVALDGARRYERFGQVFVPAVISRVYLASCHAELGTFAEGAVLGVEGLRIAEAVAQPGSLMWASWGIGLLFLRQGDLHRALPLLERAMGICQDTDLPVYFPTMAAALGAAYTMGGRVAAAVPLLTQAMEQTIAIETVVHQAPCSLPLGEAHLLAGRLEEAHTLTERALALARTYQERGHQAYALRLLGDIAAHREPPQTEPAEAYYRQALTLADDLSMHPLVAHCHLGLGTLYRQMGRGAEAGAALATAIALYRAMDMTFWLPQTEATLAQVRTGETNSSA